MNRFIILSIRQLTRPDTKLRQSSESTDISLISTLNSEYKIPNLILKGMKYLQILFS